MHLPVFTIFPLFAQIHGSDGRAFYVLVSLSALVELDASGQLLRADPCCRGTDCDSAMFRAAELAASHRCCLSVPVVGHLHLMSQPNVSVAS